MAGTGHQDPTPVDVIGDRTRAWWSQVLAGQLEQTHPTWGSEVKFKLKGDHLDVTGEVSNKQDLHELRRELDAIKGNGISGYSLGVKVKPSDTAVEGLLEQTIIAVYESADQAYFAVQLIESSFHVSPTRMKIIEPAQLDDAQTRDLVPDEYWDEVAGALRQGQALLVVTVDEVNAFKTREALDEETRSLTTYVLPPQPAGATAPGVDKAVAARPGQSPRSGQSQRRGRGKRAGQKAAKGA
jgi:hypothetical protein